MIAQAIGAVVMSVALAAGGASGCESEGKAKKASTTKVLTRDGEYGISSLKKTAPRMMAVNPGPNCKWTSFYTDGKITVVIQSGNAKNNKVNFKKSKLVKRNGKHYEYKATTFRTFGCKTWVKS